MRWVHAARRCLAAGLASWFVLTLSPGPATARPRPVEIRLQDVDVRDALRIMARLAGKNMVLAPEVKGRTTLDLKDVDPLGALQLVAAVNRYEVLVKNGVIVVGDPATIAFVRGPGTVETLTLSYGSAVELAGKLSKLYKGKVEIVADPRTNSLMLTRPAK